MYDHCDRTLCEIDNGIVVRSNTGKYVDLDLDLSQTTFSRMINTSFEYVNVIYTNFINIIMFACHKCKKQLSSRQALQYHTASKQCRQVQELLVKKK